jgi:metal-responsive CopG/Arc/MetJ family transcriptional regulator
MPDDRKVIDGKIVVDLKKYFSVSLPEDLCKEIDRECAILRKKHVPMKRGGLVQRLCWEWIERNKKL